MVASCRPPDRGGKDSQKSSSSGRDGAAPARLAIESRAPVMNCPHCQGEVEPNAESCFHCGQPLRAQTQALRKGSLIAERYEILSPLGKGGMGMVYKARDHQLDEFVAPKVLRPEVAADAEMTRRFRTEIRLARRVRHRNVCGIYEFGEAGGLNFIAMEYM